MGYIVDIGRKGALLIARATPLLFAAYFVGEGTRAGSSLARPIIANFLDALLPFLPPNKAYTL